MTNATFHNFDTEPFTGYWDGKAKTFKPGEKVYMPGFLAEHFAKHLTNKVLIRTGKEVYTSPKKPADVPEFMQLFRRAFILDEGSQGDNSLDAMISGARKEPSMDVDVKPGAPTGQTAAAIVRSEAEVKEDPYEPTGSETGPGAAPQVVSGPDADDDEEGFDHGAAAQQ